MVATRTFELYRPEVDTGSMVVNASTNYRKNSKHVSSQTILKASFSGSKVGDGKNAACDAGG
jgi:hypothetical protein